MADRQETATSHWGTRIVIALLFFSVFAQMAITVIDTSFQDSPILAFALGVFFFAAGIYGAAWFLGVSGETTNQQVADNSDNE